MNRMVISGKLAICNGRRMSLNSVLEKFRQSEFDNIEDQAEVNALSRRSINSRYWLGEYHMNRRVSSVYRL